MKVVNISLISEFLNIEDNKLVRSSDLLTDYQWDSLAMVVIQTHFSDVADVEIDPDALEKLETIEELDNFITENL